MPKAPYLPETFVRCSRPSEPRIPPSDKISYHQKKERRLAMAASTPLRLGETQLLEFPMEGGNLSEGFMVLFNNDDLIVGCSPRTMSRGSAPELTLWTKSCGTVSQESSRSPALPKLVKASGSLSKTSSTLPKVTTGIGARERTDWVSVVYRRGNGPSIIQSLTAVSIGTDLNTWKAAPVKWVSPERQSLVVTR